MMAVFTAACEGHVSTGVCMSTGGGGLPDRDPHWTENPAPWTETPLDRDPLTESSLWTGSSLWTEILPGQSAPWTETPQRPPPLDRGH